MVRVVVVAVALVSWAGLVHADPQPASPPAPPSADVEAVDDAGLYLLPHPDAAWWLSAQANSILQVQPGFHSPYAGEHSFLPGDHHAISFVVTAYAGYELTPNTGVVVAGESAGGTGLSQALGIGGFTNLDVVRNPALGAAPYIGRAFIEQVIPLSDHRVKTDRNPLRILRTLPDHRLEIRAGKFSTVDVFDPNAGATDSHLQFMNWAIDNNAAYDYAADTRGYSLGATIEYDAPLWALRFGEMLMPKVANGPDYDYDIANARGENLELEVHDCVAGHRGLVRLLGFANHANMGRYGDAIAAFRALEDTTPDITRYRVAGRIKYGFGVNAEQEVVAGLNVFGRLGWNEGRYESFAYTEVDNTLELGSDLRGGRWHRPGDKLGVAFVSNGLSKDHETYLELGGEGFLLGDGKLHYGRETIVEAYYTARAYRGIFPALDVQLVDNPGFNTDRGPVIVGSVRLHVEI
ncbi:MAG: carbohydrate porin [Kofleriaceae bacterium]